MLECVILIAILVLASIWIECLRNGEGKCHTYLVWDTRLLLAALVLYVGGYIVLKRFELAWRNRSTMILLGVILVTFLVGLVLAITCFWSELHGLAKGVVLILASVIFLGALWLGLVVFCFGYRYERVLEYQGRTLLEEFTDLPDVDYSYYEYHGPLVKGNKWVGAFERTKGGMIPIDAEVWNDG